MATARGRLVGTLDIASRLFGCRMSILGTRAAPPARHDPGSVSYGSAICTLLDPEGLVLGVGPDRAVGPNRQLDVEALVGVLHERLQRGGEVVLPVRVEVRPTARRVLTDEDLVGLQGDVLAGGRLRDELDPGVEVA